MEAQGYVNTSAGRQRIQYSGLFDFDGLYTAIVDWAKNYGFLWHEKTYKHKVPSSLGAEQELEWELSKNATPYYKYEILIWVHIYEMKEVTIDYNGKKKALINGRISFIIEGRVHWDWQSVFKGSPFRKWLGKMLISGLEKDLSSIHWDTLTYRILNLHNLIKQYLDLQTKKYEYKGYLKEN